MRCIFKLIISGLLMLPSISVAEPIPGSYFSSGNWKGAAYTSDRTGEFMHCAISASYRSGDELIFTVNRDATVDVAVASPRMDLSPGQAFPVTLYIDRRQPFYGEARAVTRNLAGLKLYDFDRAMIAIRKGYVLKVVGTNGESVYQLTGTYRALEMARQCAIQHLNYKNPNLSAPLTTEAGTSQGIDPAISYQLATQMITTLAIPDARYLTASELKEIEMSGAVYWQSQETGISGGVMFFPRSETQALREGDNTGFAFLATQCTGNYATTAQDIGEDSTSRQLRLLCTQNEGGYEGYLTATPVGQHVLISVLFFDQKTNYASQKTKPQISEDIGLRNASFAIEQLES